MHANSNNNDTNPGAGIGTSLHFRLRSPDVASTAPINGETPLMTEGRLLLGSAGVGGGGGGVMRVDGSGVTHISVARTPSFGAEQKSPSGGGDGGGVNLWEPLGAKPVGTKSVRVTNKLAPLKITSDYQVRNDRF